MVAAWRAPTLTCGDIGGQSPHPGDADSRSDEQLVAAINAGDADAFELLYRRHRDYVIRLAWRFTRDEHDALDVLQETFAYLVRKTPGLRLWASMTTYLYPVVRNLSLELLRKRRPHVGEDELLEVPARKVDDPGDLADVLGVLPAAHREVVVLRFVDGMSLEEIAAALSVPLGTVKSRLHHALLTLRESPTLRRYFEKE
jgi:RNA polymerase sigma-70 factor, ECF subfamily